LELLSGVLQEKVLVAQRDEITEYLIYKGLSYLIKDKNNAGVLERIAQEEKGHYEFFQGLTEQQVQPDKLKVFFYVFLARFFGLNFSLKLMERGEYFTQDVYQKLKEVAPRITEVIQDEREHERKLISLIDEERLKYISSVVLGLNDALVELTGALVGFTLALQNTRLVGIIGLITGIAASLSMGASEYLSTKEEDTQKDPLKAALYTGAAYVATVLLLIAPYFILKNIYTCMSLVIFFAITIIYIFTYYISVAKDLNFRKRFFEMAGISLGVAAISYIFGLVIRNVFGIDV